MAGIGVFVLWVGYAIGYYGVDQIRGGNNGLLALMRPGAFTEQPPDAPSATAGTAATGAPIPATPSNPDGIASITKTSPPKGAPAGVYGVDQNGNIYKQTTGGKWQLYAAPNSAGLHPQAD